MERLGKAQDKIGQQTDWGCRSGLERTCGSGKLSLRGALQQRAPESKRNFALCEQLVKYWCLCGLRRARVLVTGLALCFAWEGVMKKGFDSPPLRGLTFGKRGQRNGHELSAPPAQTPTAAATAA